MRIVITGGNGYLGARLSEYFADLGNEVIPLCRKPDNRYPEWAAKMFSILEGDICREETITRVTELEPDVIIHLVSLDHSQSEAEPGLVTEVNVLPAWRLLETCTKRGLKKFIYFSTAQVYGRVPNRIIDEQFPAQTVNNYGLTHYLCENICDHFNRRSDCDVISVRLSNSYGHPVFDENNCWWLAINDLCRSAMFKKEIRLLSDGSPQRDFIHGDDVCSAVQTLIGKDKTSGSNVFNISSGQTLTLMELAHEIREVYSERYGQRLPIYTTQGLADEKSVLVAGERFVMSNKKLNSLGFMPKVSVREGINRLFTYLENRNS